MLRNESLSAQAGREEYQASALLRQAERIARNDRTGAAGHHQGVTQGHESTQDYIFTATDENDRSIPAGCSFIHYEIRIPSCEDEKDCIDGGDNDLGVGMLLWCTSIITGQPVCWAPVMRLNRSKSFPSGLCDSERHQTQLAALRRYQSENLGVNNTSNVNSSSIRKHAELGWAAELEAAVLACSPRTFQAALKSCQTAFLVTEPRQPFRTVHANRIWQDLCGLEEEDAIGKALKKLHRPATESQYQVAMQRALKKCYEISLVLKNHESNGDMLMHRLRIVPILQMAQKGIIYPPHGSEFTGIFLLVSLEKLTGES